ncbi:MAG TPA: glycosyltransferase, partial [Pirellulaceae bacterium]
MRVLWISPQLPSPDRPGSMAPAARQLRSLRKLGIEFDVVEMRGVPVLKYPGAIPRVRRLASAQDLIHAHFGYCGWLARCQIRAPIVLSFMGDDLLGTPDDRGGLQWFSRVMARANRWLAGRVDAVIVKSAEMADVVAPVPAFVIPNGVDIDEFRPMSSVDAARELGWDPDAQHLLFPGNPENPRKGYELARAATQAAESALGRPLRLVPLWGVDPGRVPLHMNACAAMWMTSLVEGSPNVV